MGPKHTRAAGSDDYTRLQSLRTCLVFRWTGVSWDARRMAGSIVLRLGGGSAQPLSLPIDPFVPEGVALIPDEPTQFPWFTDVRAVCSMSLRGREIPGVSLFRRQIFARLFPRRDLRRHAGANNIRTMQSSAGSRMNMCAGRSNGRFGQRRNGAQACRPLRAGEFLFSRQATAWLCWQGNARPHAKIFSRSGDVGRACIDV